MSADMLRDAIARHAISGYHGLAITAIEGDAVAGVDIAPDWFKQYKELPFEVFARWFLEPCFASLVAHLEEQNAKIRDRSRKDL